MSPEEGIKERVMLRPCVEGSSGWVSLKTAGLQAAGLTAAGLQG